MDREKTIESLVNDYGYDEEKMGQLEDGVLLGLYQMEIDGAEAEGVDLENPEDGDDGPPSGVEHVAGGHGGTGRTTTTYVDAPLYTSPKWNDYVMSHFVEEELFDGSPTVDGLRRVTELLLGEIISSKTKVLQFPDPSNNDRATVVVEVHILSQDGMMDKVFDGAADAGRDNLDSIFAKFPVANAEARAEGRALRKALRLRKCAAEELGGDKGNVSSKSGIILEPLNESQVKMIDMVAKSGGRGLNINVEKLLKQLAEKGVLVYNSVKELSHEDGQILFNALSAYQANRDTIPLEIIGYDSKWREATK